MDDDLTSKTDAELARMQERNLPTEEPAILSRQELQKRLIEIQHKFNRELIKEQHELNKAILKKQLSLAKVSIICAFLGVIVGATLQSYLPILLSRDRPVAQKVSLEQSFPPTTETIQKGSVKRQVLKSNELSATKEKDDSVSSKSPPRK
jgi:hypothetical protein